MTEETPSPKRRLDVLYERRRDLVLNQHVCSSFGYFDRERHDQLSEELGEVENEIEALERELT